MDRKTERKRERKRERKKRKRHEDTVRQGDSYETVRCIDRETVRRIWPILYEDR